MKSPCFEFPTALHATVAWEAAGFFESTPASAVLLVNSCARGTATPHSDLDLAVLVSPDLAAHDSDELLTRWGRFYEENRLFREFEGIGEFTRVHLDLFDGRFEPQLWDDGGGPDSFELEIGNRVARAVPLWERDGAFAELAARWLPYYGEALRGQRLAMVVHACQHDLKRVRAGADRNLHFYAFDRLYHALQEFLQALFIARTIYPIAYDKWIREQVEGWLGLPDLYTALTTVLCIERLDTAALHGRAEHLDSLLVRWVTGTGGAENECKEDPATVSAVRTRMRE